MSAFTQYLEKLGNNFLVSAMVPSLALVAASLLLFDPTLLNKLGDVQNAYALINLGLLVFLLTFIIGFTLTALNTYILKFFEGYVPFLPLHGAFYKSRRIHHAKANYLKVRSKSLEDTIGKMQDQLPAHPELQPMLKHLQDEYYNTAMEYDQTYPAKKDEILATRFGNILRAAENHAADRYGFDGVMFWPRLMHVIPTDYKQALESSRNELSFLVNMSLLSMVFSLLCIVAMFRSLDSVTVVSGSAAAFTVFLLHVFKYLFVSALGIAICGFFYNASIYSLNSFALMIRSAFDLFRLDLLKKLEVVRPRDSEREYKTWYNLNEMIVLGSRSLTVDTLHYRKEKPERPS